jgi:type I restriction-modification system DNA methylase subunit
LKTTIEVFREEIRKLVEKFERDKYFYLSKQYLEAQARQDFIDRFFEALGWDIGNKAELSPFEREVLLEKGETKGRPDYNFRIGGATKFYVEAKAPSEPLDKTAHIMQAKLYAWNTKDVFIVVLTDFEEFKVFDASLKPDPRNPNLGLIYDFKYTDYLEKLDKLWTLSRDEVASSSLDKLLLKDAQSKRLRIPVDKSFLSDMTGWREELAKDLYRRNPDITVRMLNEVVQRILDRFVFIRTAEDRKIIEPKSLLELVELWKREGKRRPLLYHLNILFRQINGDLNGEIFKPHACESYEFDSSLLAKIIEWLYFPKCPYRFDVIGVELLGSIYERYLGNTIRLTAKRVKVEEKPEVRKAGGVYYTPKYVVDYIVNNTVGKLIEGKTPEEIASIKIIDPACGSGSFLLGAYQKLIDYHIKYYTEHPAEAGRSTLFPDLIIDPDGSHRLSITKKAEILQNNIYGVDIDPQAVEVSMMSLYIKALEGERTLPQNKELLPSLANNLKCGNSLIGYDFFEQQTLIEDEERERINPFDWNSKKVGFGDIMEKGGFDCVVGNPPWVDIKGMDPDLVDYYFQRYSTTQNRMNIYATFVQKSLEILYERGRFGFITPSSYLTQSSYTKLRKLILENTWIQKLVRLPDKVFTNVKAETAIVILEKNGIGRTSILLYNRADEISKISEQTGASEKMFSQKNWLNSPD